VILALSRGSHLLLPGSSLKAGFSPAPYATCDYSHTDARVSVCVSGCEGPVAPRGVDAQLALSACALGGVADCHVVPPSQLPSGAKPGSAVESVAGGAKQIVWGEGLDRVDLRMGPSYRASEDKVLREVTIRGVPGTIFQIEPDWQVGLGLTWTEGECDCTVFLDPQVSVPAIADFATRY
jgi:hypothetical protein